MRDFDLTQKTPCHFVLEAQSKEFWRKNYCCFPEVTKGFFFAKTHPI